MIVIFDNFSDRYVGQNDEVNSLQVGCDLMRSVSIFDRSCGFGRHVMNFRLADLQTHFCYAFFDGLMREISSSVFHIRSVEFDLSCGQFFPCTDYHSGYLNLHFDFYVR